MQVELDFGMTGAGSVGAAADWARKLRQDGRLAGMRSFLLKRRDVRSICLRAGCLDAIVASKRNDIDNV